MNQNYPIHTLLGGIFADANKPVRRRIFVSYHHKHDQAYYDAFSKTLHDQMDLFFDNSLDRLIDSENTDYVIQRIRDDFITQTSCTIVLCGPETQQRKYVDWEIKATLDKQHGLIGIALPTASVTQQGNVIVPDRLFSNYQSGFAVWKTWADLTANPVAMVGWIEDAVKRDVSKIVNPREIKTRNG